MHLTSDDVKKVASLARLKVTESEVQSLLNDLTAITDYVEVLNEVNTADVVPMVHAVELSDVFRSDVVIASLPRSDALRNAPRTDGEHFLVPSIIDG